MSFASCASDTASDSPLPSKDMKAYLQVKVTVEGSGDTRASRAGEDDKYHFTENPSGGEDGDGDDVGELNERTVTNLNLLLYSSSKNDMSDDGAIIERLFTFSTSLQLVVVILEYGNLHRYRYIMQLLKRTIICL